MGELQWSHAQLSVETATEYLAVDRLQTRLQWSHAHERGNLRGRARRTSDSRGFNGATLSERGNIQTRPESWQ